MKLRLSSSRNPRDLLCLVGIVLALIVFTGRAATINGHMVAWGTNECPALGAVPSLTNVSAVAAGGCYSIALLSDGTVVGWGNSSSGIFTPPSGLAGVRAIAAGGSHFLALKSDGKIVAWGENASYQTNVPYYATNVSAIAAGQYHSVALTSNGTQYAWGDNGQHQCDYNGYGPFKSIAAGAYHTLALGTDGNIYPTGRNLEGQCTIPGAVTLGTVAAIAAGASHSLAIRANGTVLGWGQTFYGQCNLSDLTGVAAVNGGQYHTLVLLSNHTVVVRGDNSVGQANIPSGLTNVAAISTTWNANLAVIVDPPVITTQPLGQTNLAGANVTFTVAATGSLPVDFQWRKNSNTIAGATSTSFTITNVQLTNTGFYDVIVANAMGSVTSSVASLLVNSPPFITNQPSGLTLIGGTNVIATFTVGADGSAPLKFQWWKDATNRISNATNRNYSITNLFPSNAGNYAVIITNLFGSITSAPAALAVNMKPAITNPPAPVLASVGASAAFTVGASYADGYQWRRNNGDIPGANGSTYFINSVQTNDAGNYTVVVTNAYGAVTSGVAALTLRTLPSGSTTVSPFGEWLVFDGSNYYDVTPPSGLSSAIAVSVGLYHDLALLSDNSVIGWGDNTYGQAASGQTGATNISAGGRHSLALLSTTNRPVAWGANDFGQCNVPASATNVVGIAAGWNHSVAVRSDGSVVAWGTNNAGQGTVPPTVSNLVAIAAGAEHNLGLRNNGTVLAWGDNSYGQAHPPALVTNVTAGVLALAAGQHHSLALRSNGTVVCWGRNQFNQTNVPAGLTNVIAIAAGANHSVALKSDGTVTGWGQNNSDQITFPENLSGVFAIAAGGDRTVLLSRRHTVLLAPLRRGGGGLTLLLANSDGSAADSGQFSRLQVRATTNLTANITNWISYTTGFTLTTNGLIRWDDTNATGLPRRFYRIGETP